MHNPRRVGPEWLDQLPPDDPRAIRSRRDLRRLNQVMGHVGLLTSILQRDTSAAPLGLVELGAGDGTFLLELARRMKPRGSDVDALLVDQQTLLQADTESAFVLLGWRVRTVQADVFAWLRSPSTPTWTVTTTNLFLHHFQDAELTQLFKSCAARCEIFVACEPRRSLLALVAAQMVRFIGCSSVTRHDAVTSVRAGFRDGELSRLWPGPREEWRLDERSAGLFSHVFCARRRYPKS